jgi:hypothetical protein
VKSGKWKVEAGSWRLEKLKVKSEKWKLEAGGWKN